MRRDMKNSDVSESHQVTYKINVHLNEFCSLMLNWICGHINGAYVLHILVRMMRINRFAIYEPSDILENSVKKKSDIL